MDGISEEVNGQETKKSLQVIILGLREVSIGAFHPPRRKQSLCSLVEEPEDGFHLEL